MQGREGKKKITGQISGYYPAASLINQSSLCSGAVDNTKGDANAIEHLEEHGGWGEREEQKKRKENRINRLWNLHNQNFFKYLINVIFAFSAAVITLVNFQGLVSDVRVVFLISHENSSRYSPEVMGDKKISRN